MPSPEKLLRHMWGCAPPLIIEAALRNKIFETLSKGPMTLPDNLAPIMDALSGLELVVKDGDTWKLTEESAAYLVSKNPGYLGGMLHHISALSSFRHEASSVAADILGIADATGPIRLVDFTAGVWGIAIAQKSPYVNVTAVGWSGILEMAEKFGLADRFSIDLGTGYEVATVTDINEALLKKVFNVLVPGGTIVITEFGVRSYEEIKTELEEAGFIKPGLVPAPGPSPLIFADKP